MTTACGTRPSISPEQQRCAHQEEARVPCRQIVARSVLADKNYGGSDSDCELASVLVIDLATEQAKVATCIAHRGQLMEHLGSWAY